MRTSHARTRDRTRDAPDEVHHPGVVAELEALGFERVGRLGMDLEPAVWQEMLAEYSPSDADVMAAAERVPAVVLVSPDGDAYVDVDWFWGGPSVRFRTELTNHRVLETQLQWRELPAMPRRLRRAARHRVLAEEQLIEVAPGRDLTAREGDMGSLWAIHRHRLARTGQAVNHARDMGQVTALYDRFLQHSLRWAVRASRLASVLNTLLPLLAAVLSIWLTISDHVLWAAVVILVAGLVPVALAPRVAIRMRYVRSMRPTWR